MRYHIPNPEISAKMALSEFELKRLNSKRVNQDKIDIIRRKIDTLSKRSKKESALYREVGGKFEMLIGRRYDPAESKQHAIDTAKAYCTNRILALYEDIARINKHE